MSLPSANSIEGGGTSPGGASLGGSSPGGSSSGGSLGGGSAGPSIGPSIGGSTNSGGGAATAVLDTSTRTSEPSRCGMPTFCTKDPRCGSELHDEPAGRQGVSRPSIATGPAIANRQGDADAELDRRTRQHHASDDEIRGGLPADHGGQADHQGQGARRHESGPLR